MRPYLLIGFAALLLFAAAGCERETEGPAERAGKVIDQNVEKTAEGMSEALDSAAEKIEEAGEGLRRGASE